MCDRYLGDTRLDFNRSFPDINFEGFILWKVLVYIAPKPDCSFVLWIPVSLSLKRSIDKNEPFPDDEATLLWRLHHYLDENLFPSSTNNKIDCSNDLLFVKKMFLFFLKCE